MIVKTDKALDLWINFILLLIRKCRIIGDAVLLMVTTDSKHKKRR